MNGFTLALAHSLSLSVYLSRPSAAVKFQWSSLVVGILFIPDHQIFFVHTVFKWCLSCVLHSHNPRRVSLPLRSKQRYWTHSSISVHVINRCDERRLYIWHSRSFISLILTCRFPKIKHTDTIILCLKLNLKKLNRWIKKR